MNTKEQIKKLEKAIASPVTPETQKEAMRKKLEELKGATKGPKAKKAGKTPSITKTDYMAMVTEDIAELNEISESEAKAVCEKPENTSLIETGFETGTSPRIVAKRISDIPLSIANLEEVSKKSKKKVVKKEATKTPAKPDYDCDELIEREKKRRAGLKKAHKKIAEQASKTPATKNKETIEKAADKVETNIKNRVEKGEVSKSELEKLIAEAEELLNFLKKALKKMHGK